MKTWLQNIADWRALPVQEKLRRRSEAIPLDVAQSMAFEQEPVAIEWIQEKLATHVQKTRRDSSKRD